MSCCTDKDHAALKASAAWDALPRLKKMDGITTDADGQQWEWKNCPTCDSTLVKPLRRRAA